MAIDNLNDLLLNLYGMSNASMEELGRDLYSRVYLNQGHFGLHKTHDGELLIYFQSQFEHAFFTTSDRRYFKEGKDILRPPSIARIHWIGEVVAGNVRGSACYAVPSTIHPDRPPKRLYAVYKTPFVVWLEPRFDGDGWKFSSAYPVSIEDIRKYTRNCKVVWKWKEKNPVIDGLTGQSLVQAE